MHTQLNDFAWRIKVHLGIGVIIFVCNCLNICVFISIKTGNCVKSFTVAPELVVSCLNFIRISEKLSLDSFFFNCLFVCYYLVIFSLFSIKSFLSFPCHWWKKSYRLFHAVSLPVSIYHFYVELLINLAVIYMYTCTLIHMKPSLVGTNVLEHATHFHWICFVQCIL